MLQLSLQQKQRLSTSQKLELQQLLLIKQKLTHPEYPDAIKGFEGIEEAHKILQYRKATGVLIGGLSQAVWNQRRKKEDLSKHKDTDVLVLDSLDIPQFYGGVDWWLPRKEKIKIKSYYATIEEEKQFYVNGNGVILSFGAEKTYDLRPGLYIPSAQWISDMRMAETEAHIDYRKLNIEPDEEVIEKFREKLLKTIGTKLPKFISQAFKGYILSSDYETNYRKVNAVRLETFDIETLVSLNTLEEALKQNP